MMHRIRHIACVSVMIVCTACGSPTHPSHSVAMSEEEAALISSTMLSYVYEHYPAATTGFSIVSADEREESDAVFSERFVQDLRSHGYAVQESSIAAPQVSRDFVPLSYVATTLDDGMLARLYLGDQVISRYFAYDEGGVLPVSGFTVGSRDDE